MLRVSYLIWILHLIQQQTALKLICKDQYRKYNILSEFKSQDFGQNSKLEVFIERFNEPQGDVATTAFTCLI